MTGKLLRVTEVAAFFDMSEYTIRDWLKSGKMNGSKIGKEWRVTEEEVARLAQLEYGDQR